MFRVFRPSFEVVKVGRILNFVSGYRKVERVLVIDNLLPSITPSHP
jgi:hypothetical protein